MRRRLVALLVPVLVLLVLGVGVAYGVLTSERATQAAHVDRTGDATRFASMVDAAADSGDTTRLSAELADYQELYASPVWVLGLDGQVVHDPGLPLPDGEEFEVALRRAFAGDRPAEVPTIWPWSQRPLHVVEPVGRDSQVTGVVVIEAPTDSLRTRLARTWVLGGGVLLAPVGVMVAGLWPVTRWMLRPVRDLERIAATIRAGDLDARADVEHGPAELRELASAFNATVEEVQRSLRRQRAFVADAAHQLRNPLASLRLAVENLRPWVHGPDADEAYHEAVEEAERMSAMFEAMLAATELAGSERPGDDLPLTGMLASGAERWRQVLAAAGIRLEIAEPVPPLVVRQPAGGLPAVLDELVANAARLSGGSVLRIGAQQPGDQPGRAGPGGVPTVDLVVADDGVGIDPGDLDAATGRFWRASRHQNVPGTGLGLAILSDVLADVGGSLRLEPNQPAGLRAVVRLPVVARSAATAAGEAPAAGPATEAPDDGGADAGPAVRA